MSGIETVNQDTRSYRQGLVLGLTMAEVFLLLVFALLIALGALWTSEREKRQAAEDKLGGPAAITAADKSLLDNVKSVISATGEDKVTKALDHLKQGHDLEPLSKSEKDFFETVRRQHRNSKPQAISDDWRELSRDGHLDGIARASAYKRPACEVRQGRLHAAVYCRMN